MLPVVLGKVSKFKEDQKNISIYILSMFETYVEEKFNSGILKTKGWVGGPNCKYLTGL